MPSGAAKRSGNATVVTDKPGIRKVDGQIGASWHCCSRVLVRGIVRELEAVDDGKSIRWVGWFFEA